MRTSSGLLVTFAVCSLQFKFEWQEGLTAVGDLQEFFWPLTIILLFSLTFKSTKQLSTQLSDVLVRAGDKHYECLPKV